MTPITYDLRGDGESSDQFYSDLSTYVDRLLGGLDPELVRIVDGYHSWTAARNPEPVRSWEEHFFDFLMTGVLWNEYIPWAKQLTRIEYRILHYLYGLRRKYRWMKPGVDKVRGILGTLLLRKRRTIFPHLRSRTGGSLPQLVRWLQASGDFREEAIRLARVEEYLSTISARRHRHILSMIMECATRFKNESIRYFGEYTANVEKYIRRNSESKRWQENFIFCTRREVEYIMNMVGAEIMNRVMADDFANTQRKYALLPACMRQRPDRCEAKRISLDMICTGCDVECNIYKFREVGKQDGFAVRIIPHSSDFSQWLKSWAVGKEIGVIGVACPLHLIAGGLELRELGIDAQCVFLDYCGCKNHWSENGVMTDMNVNRLLELVDAERRQIAA